MPRVRYLGPPRVMMAKGPSGETYVFVKNSACAIAPADWQWVTTRRLSWGRFEVIEEPEVADPEPDIEEDAEPLMNSAYEEGD